MKTSVDELWINMRAYNALTEAGIQTIEDLTKPQNWHKLLAQKGCGKSTIVEITMAIMVAVGGQLKEDAERLEKAYLKLENQKKTQNL